MGKSSAPPAPDYTGAARAEAAGQQQLVNQQTIANRPNVHTPWGSSTWTRGPTGGSPQGNVPGVGPMGPMPPQMGQPTAPQAPGPAPSGGSSAPPFSFGIGGGGSDRNLPPWAYQDSGTDENSGDRQLRGPQPTMDGPQSISGQYDFGDYTTNWGSGPIPSGEQWTNTISLSPQEQQALEAQQRINAGRSGLAESLMPQVRDQMARGFNWEGLSPMAGRVSPGQLTDSIDQQSFQRQLNGTAGDWRERAQSAVEDLQRPQLEERRAAVETQLANQGITRGSEAWDSSMRELADAESRAGLQAIAAGRDEANAMFGQDLESGRFTNDAISRQLSGDIAAGTFENTAQAQALESQLAAGQFDNQLRQMGITEEQIRRGVSLNELNALLSGQQVGMPNFPQAPQAGQGQAPRILDAANQQYQGALDAFGVQQANRSSTMQGLGQAAMLAFMFSDRRLKRDIEYLGFTLPNGVRLYKYRFVGKPNMEIGVIAQEVRELIPDAVRVDPHGYLLVDYSKVLA